MRVLGIDPGSRVLGYGVVETTGGSGLVHVCDGAIILDPSRPLPERLLAISEALDRLIEEHGPEEMAVEAVFFSKNARSALMLGHARGVALLCAAARGLSVHEYPPRSIKLAVTGHGNAAKEQVQKMVRALLAADTDSITDASDALAAAICHINHSRYTKAASRAAAGR